MVKIPVRFKRVAEAFDGMARDGRSRLCESSGSEHSAADDESSMDLSDLVNSFLESGHEDPFNVVHEEEEEEENDDDDDEDDEGGKHKSRVSQYEALEEDLIRLFRTKNDDYVKKMIHAEVEKAWVGLGGFESSPAKRQLMALLRLRGLDAGLCKSKWDKKGSCPPGVYEYIDVIVEGTRYIVEVALASEFEIARQTGHYTSLLQLFPTIYVGEARKLKKIVRVMSNLIRMSMKKEAIHVPPWRRLAYMRQMVRTLQTNHQ